MKFPRVFLLILWAWGMAMNAGMGWAQSDLVEVYALKESDLVYSYDTGIITATNDFAIRFQDGVLTAQRGTIDQNTGDVFVEGNVVLERGPQVWRGELLEYNFITRRLKTDEFRAGQSPFFSAGRVLSADVSTNTFAARRAFLTTDDAKRPGYRIATRSLRLVEGRYFEARDAVLYLGKVPVFYWPYYRRAVDARGTQFTVTPGYRSAFGPFLRGAYNWTWDENLSGALNVDYRYKVGVGFGPDASFNLGGLGQGDLSFYYTHDRDPGSVSPDLAVPIPKDRERLRFAFHSEPLTNLSVRLSVNQQSDPFVTRDFFESEYRSNPQPSTFAEATYDLPNFNVSALSVFQVNRFFETVERLPDVKVTGLRQQLGVSPFYYESESSLGYFNRAFASTNVAGATNYAAFRADTFHQLLLPQTWFGWLNVTPFAGGRFTYYGSGSGPGAYTSEQNRWVFNTGAEASFKVSRVWGEARSGLLDLEGLRHIAEPSLQYVYVPEPSARPPELPQFDTALPALELPPIEFPDDSSIDSIDSRNTLRLGFRNKLQTRRRDRVENLLNWSLFTDWRITRLDGQSRFSDVYSKLDFSPRSWITLSSQLRFEVGGPLFREINTTLTLTPNDRWSVSVGQRYLRDDPEFEAYYGVPYRNNLYFGTFFYRLNENYGVRAYARYNADSGHVEEQQYTLYRDFRSWTGAVTLRIRKDESGPTDFGAAVTFSLKAFPRFGLGDDASKPSLLLGG